MPNAHPNPSSSVEHFLEQYILGREGLVLTVKSPGGAAVNIDGPFELRTFLWSQWRPDAKELDERVIAPARAKAREKGESDTHLHVPWSSVSWLRLQYLTSSSLPLIDLRVRIAIYADRPQENQRGTELFWFYADESHPLAKELPQESPSEFSRAVWIDEFMRMAQLRTHIDARARQGGRPFAE